MIRYLILSSFCLFPLFTWPACSSNTVSKQAVVITVGDQSITVRDIDKILNITSLEHGIPKKELWSSIDSLVDKIVGDSLILEYGKDKGITLSEIELQEAIQDIVKDYPDNTFEETLLNKAIDYNEWKERFREQLLVRKIVKEQTESLTPISYHAVKSYYQEREKDFWHPPRARFMHIVNKTRKEAEAVLVRLRQGEDMTKLVEEQSIHSGLQGDYDNNWVTKGTLPSSLSDIVFSIQVDKLSNIVKTPYGFHIVKVLKREPRGKKILLEVMGEIKDRLFSEAIERHYTAWVKQLRNNYPVKVNYTLLDKIRTINNAG
jgi:parvulin-like peptidyl-prolyl isomerase